MIMKHIMIIVFKLGELRRQPRRQQQRHHYHVPTLSGQNGANALRYVEVEQSSEEEVCPMDQCSTAPIITRLSPALGHLV